jgi:hypothetical protein
MPAVPLGGLSLFLNVSIVIIGVIARFAHNKGFSLVWPRYALSLMTERRFDTVVRRIFGFSIMLTVFVFLFVSTGISFIKRMTIETNIDLIHQSYP